MEKGLCMKMRQRHRLYAGGALFIEKFIISLA